MTGPTAKGLPALCSTADVAAALNWTPEVIRQHLVPFSEWEEMDALAREGKVPYVKLGRRYKIPRFWLEDILKATQRPEETR